MGKKTCGSCNGEKNTAQFYKVPTAPTGFSSICKVCTKEKLKTYTDMTGSEAGGVWLVLAELGVPFIHDVWKKAELELAAAKQNTDVIMVYLKVLSESGIVYRGFVDSDIMLDMLVDTNVDREAEAENEEIDLHEQQRIWGKFLDEQGQVDIEAYELLNSAFEDYTKDVFEMDTNLERRYRDLAKCDLRLRRANEAGDGGEISKAQDALNKQLALLKMNDFRSTQVDERKKHIDRIAWMIEETEPAEEEDENAYRDIKGYEKIYNSWMRSMRNILAGQRDYPDITKEEM